MSCNRQLALDGKLYQEDINFLCPKDPGIQKPMILVPDHMILRPNPVILGPDHMTLVPNSMIL